VLKLIKRLLLGLLILTGVALAVTRARDRKASAEFWANPPVPVGEMVTWDGGELHLYCTGEGGPLVMLISGLGDHYRGWNSVQRNFPETVRACSYDRSGLGYAPPSDAARTPTRAASELQAAIVAAAPAGTPVILVGHSLGGLYARHYAHMFPRDVAGLVLVDPSHEDQIERLPLPPLFTTIGQTLPNWLRSLGVSRALYERRTRDQERRSADLGAEFYASGRSAAAAAAEWKGMKRAASEVRTAPRVLGSRPLVILSAGRVELPFGMDAAAVQAEWYTLHDEILAESTRGRRVVVIDATHYIHVDAPAEVLNEILLMVDSVRAAGN